MLVDTKQCVKDIINVQPPLVGILKFVNLATVQNRTKTILQEVTKMQEITKMNEAKITRVQKIARR